MSETQKLRDAAERQADEIVSQIQFNASAALTTLYGLERTLKELIEKEQTEERDA